MSALRSLSLFFPMYNEAAAMATTVDRARHALQLLGVTDYEIILVDDGSRDGSSELADKLAAQHAEVKVVHHDVNKGYGEALKSGFAAATKDWVMYTDGDGQFNVADLQQFLPHVADHDVLLGYRLARRDNWLRKLNAALWTLAVWATIGVKVRDLDCGFKLMRREVLQKVLPLQSGGAVISAELVAKLQRRGVRMREVGVTHYPRHGGKATGANWQVIMRAFRELRALREQLRGLSAR